VSDTTFQRGEVYLIDLGDPVGHQPNGLRPGVIVSCTYFNKALPNLIFVLPFTTNVRGLLSEVPVDPPEGGMKKRCAVRTDQLRAVAVVRFQARLGRISPKTMNKVDHLLRLILDL